MKTNSELEALIQNLIARVNRVEASVAHITPRTTCVDADVEHLCQTTQDAIDAIDAAITIQLGCLKGLLRNVADGK